MPASIAAQSVDNQNAVTQASPIFGLTIPIPPGLTSAFLFVQVIFDNNNNDAGVPALEATFDDVPMVCSTAMMSVAEAEQSQMVAYLPIGDGSAFPGEFSLDFTTVVPTPPNVMVVSASYQIVDGLVQDETPVDSATAIVLDDAEGETLVPSVDAGVDEAFVITMCASGMRTVPTLSLPVGYTNADDFLTGGTFGFRGTTAWLLAATGVQTVTWGSFGSSGLGGARAMALVFAIVPPDPPPDPPSFNCDCDTAEGSRQLGDLRLALLRATGYAAQANNPPPGIREMYNDFLNSAQRYIYTRYRSLQTERFFSWTLTIGQRFYGVLDNVDNCATRLDRYNITGVWIQDLNNTWWPLRAGINPGNYTMVNWQGWPTMYEVRQCIELFPAPQDAYTLWIKGNFGLTTMVNDTDLTTIEAEPVLLHAIGMAKRHKGMPDATDYFKMADGHIKSMVAGSHTTRRYVPGTRNLPVMAPPVMVVDP